MKTQAHVLSLSEAWPRPWREVSPLLLQAQLLFAGSALGRTRAESAHAANPRHRRGGSGATSAGPHAIKIVKKGFS